MIWGSVVSIRISSFGGTRFSTFELARAGLKSACDGGVRGSHDTCNSMSCTSTRRMRAHDFFFKKRERTRRER